MFDNFEAYFFENVWDTYKKLEKSRKTIKVGISSDLRISLTSASALFHLREHLPVTKSQSYASIVHRCSDYELLGDVVNASKHNTITQKKNPLINGASDISEVLFYTKYQDDKGEYRHLEKAVIIKLKDGTERDLFEVMTNVLNMWLQLLYNLGLIRYVKPKDIRRKGLPKRTKNTGKLNFEILPGLRWGFKMRWQQYNYESGQIEPEDLSGRTYALNIYEPTYTVTLTHKDEKTGCECSYSIKINEKEKKQLENFKTDQQRFEFIIKKGIEQGMIKPS